jgi:exopolysaccharide production protein ExoZ
MSRSGDEARGTGQQLWTVQWLRAAAALMVVVGHSQSAVAMLMRSTGGNYTRSALLPWGASVDLFFVISGFIMVHASRRLFGTRRAWVGFLKGRLKRIIPLYWLTTTVYLAVLIAATLKGGDPFPRVSGILASYLFVPADTWGNGRLFPVFDLGWTLNYEMFFYALFAVAVGFTRRRAAGLVILMLLVFVALGLFVPPSAGAAWFWTRPIMVDFGLGLVVGLAMAEEIRLPAALRVALVLASAAMLVADPTHLFNGPLGSTVANDWPRVIVSGIPSALLLAGAVLGPGPRHLGMYAPLTKLGDASYSLYLLHPFALMAMEKLVQKVPSVRGLGGGILVLGTVAMATLLAFASYRWIESPIARLLASRRAAPRQAAPVDQAAIEQGV